MRNRVKCGQSNSLDGSENHLGNIKSLEGYTMQKPEGEYHFLSSEDESESES